MERHSELIFGISLLFSGFIIWAIVELASSFWKFTFGEKLAMKRRRLEIQRGLPRYTRRKPV